MQACAVPRGWASQLPGSSSHPSSRRCHARPVLFLCVLCAPAQGPVVVLVSQACYNGARTMQRAKFPCLPKENKSTALVLLNNAVRRLVPGEAQDKLRALGRRAGFSAVARLCRVLRVAVPRCLVDARRQLAFKSLPMPARWKSWWPIPKRCIV